MKQNYASIPTLRPDNPFCAHTRPLLEAFSYKVLSGDLFTIQGKNQVYNTFLVLTFNYRNHILAKWLTFLKEITAKSK